MYAEVIVVAIIVINRAQELRCELVMVSKIASFE